MWVIPRLLINKILGHAQRVAPNECVGVLSGQGREITEWHPLENALAQTDRFLAEPSQQISLFKRLRNENREVLAIYHSHPGAAAIPSERDLRLAEYPEALHLIVSLNTKGCLEINGYRIRNGQFQEEALTIRE